MDVTSNNVSKDTESGAKNDNNQSEVQTECILKQPSADAMFPNHSPAETPPLLTDRLEESDESLTDSFSTNDVSQLLPAIQKQKGVESSSEPPPVCSPPSSSTCSLPPPPPASSSSTSNHHHLHHHHHHHHRSSDHNRLSSTRSHASLKTDATHIKAAAGDDCCVHFLLACLFCNLASMCSAVGECLACGVGVACCCDASVGSGFCVEAACSEEACQDCWILEDCCCSSECMEICLECCSICFPS